MSTAVTTEALPEARGTAPVRPASGRSAAMRTVKYALLLLFLCIVLMPAYVLIVTSFKGIGDATPTRAWRLPTEWETAGWQRAWEVLAPALGRTFSMVIPAAIISALIGSMNGFVLSRWRFPGADIVFTLILFGMFIPYQAVMIPLVQLVQSLGVPSGVPSLVLLHVVYGLPITTLIFRNYYVGVPTELVEAGKIDGADFFRVFWYIMLPISVPGFVVVAIWQFTSIWNEFLFGLIITNAPELRPVTVALQNLSGSQFTKWNVQMAGALMVALPTMLVYIFLGRYFLRGLMAGSLKG
jgi:glucose/mannose transport system permease protein